ncbi:hypothetical protein FA09DRAFT_337122 [Tilletiopsis washingtonensis]|uniref:Membrane-associated proteins in eicosanoid and glutathione metabolism n=1 Tax=Tilletiopsis washingtonensis TaxID=58919 RepID=A0A316ZCV6_9BASI|nr:hypothetical protein FA09DRAFT_337122 [Tilletiopsis washingtonensis]PWN99607.1 hypothetical protein FA09DRAFT_337122 [Tilletiopsis washingtonensis]
MSILSDLNFGLFTAGAPNYSLHALPVVLFFAALPHWWAIATVERLQRDPKHPFFRGGWDNQNPRAWVARLNAHVAAGKRLSPLEQRVLRAQSAQQNGFESFAQIAAAILAGNFARLPSHELNRVAAIYLATRLVYNYLYVTTGSKSFSFVRTIVFNTGTFVLVRLLFRAGNALRYAA